MISKVSLVVEGKSKIRFCHKLTIDGCDLIQVVAAKFENTTLWQGRLKYSLGVESLLTWSL